MELCRGAADFIFPSASLENWFEMPLMAVIAAWTYRRSFIMLGDPNVHSYIGRIEYPCPNTPIVLLWASANHFNAVLEFDCTMAIPELPNFTLGRDGYMSGLDVKMFNYGGMQVNGFEEFREVQEEKNEKILKLRQRKAKNKKDSRIRKAQKRHFDYIEIDNSNFFLNINDYDDIEIII